MHSGRKSMLYLQGGVPSSNATYAVNGTDTSNSANSNVDKLLDKYSNSLEGKSGKSKESVIKLIAKDLQNYKSKGSISDEDVTNICNKLGIN